jgi:uncharacterized protein (DUF427 family)
MGKSPGHKEHPEHKVRESRVDRMMRVQVDGETVAQSNDVIRVDEDGNPARYYFPRAAVPAAKLERSTTTTRCPFKGTAHYFNLAARGRKYPDAVWTYEDPYEEHAGLKDRLAFYDDQIGEMKISTVDTAKA